MGTELVQDSATYAYYDDDQVRTITDPRNDILTHAYASAGRKLSANVPLSCRGVGIT